MGKTVQINFTYIGLTESGLTKIYHVSCNGIMLGIIKWYGPWRKYTFFPETNTLFDFSCLLQIVHFLGQLMKEREK